jgi:hypothetical protein
VQKKVWASLVCLLVLLPLLLALNIYLSKSCWKHFMKPTPLPAPFHSTPEYPTEFRNQEYEVTFQVKFGTKNMRWPFGSNPSVNNKESDLHVVFLFSSIVADC